jgi:hypothetical protein
MDRQITIQVVTPTQTDSGELLRDWTTATSAQVWAEWVPSSAIEKFMPQQRSAAYIDGMYRIYDIDPRPSPDENTRIVGHDGRIYDLKGVTEIGRGAGLDLAVTARGE